MPTFSLKPVAFAIIATNVISAQTSYSATVLVDHVQDNSGSMVTPSGTEDNLCSLREAIMSINLRELEPGCRNTGEVFGVDDQIVNTLESDSVFATTSALSVTAGTTVAIDLNDGTITGAGNHRILAIDQSAVTLSNATITNGGNTRNGGGINVYRGSLNLSNSTLSENRASNKGGGIYAGYSDLNLNDSVVSDNSSDRGGGIYAYDGAFTLSKSTVSDNTASDGGGGIYVDKITMNMRDSTVSGNSAAFFGGALYQSSGSVSLSTLSSNSSRYGAGVYLHLGNLSVLNSTLTGNSASSYGGAVFAARAQAILDVENTVITGNHASAGHDIYEDNAPVTINHSLLGDASQTSIESIGSIELNPTNINANADGNTPTQLSGIVQSLASNGAQTKTHALAVNSPARAAADTEKCPSADQRGVIRDTDDFLVPIRVRNGNIAVIDLSGSCDMGSVEGLTNVAKVDSA